MRQTGRVRNESGRPTIHDVARETGLSIATISRALHMTNSPNVSAKTRERVKEAARSLGYQPNLAGRSLVTGRSNTISYWGLSLFSPYYSRITEHVCFEGSRRGFHVAVNGANDPAHSLDDQSLGVGTGNAFASNFDGIIACDVAFSENEYASSLRSQNRPFVSMGFNTSPQSDNVTLDLAAAARLGLEHLLSTGAQRIAFLSTAHESDPRTAMYHQMMDEAGREPIFIRLPYDSRPQARDAVKSFVEEDRALGRPLPDAIFTKNDEVAIGACRGLFDAGIHVPDDVLLLGCDGLEDGEYAACPLSTVALPLAEMCRLAWDFLENRLQNPTLPVQNAVLQPSLLFRQSTKA